MANHLRRQIREGVALAITSLATTGNRVFQSRVYPTQVAEMPCLLVYTREETVEPETIHAPRVLKRNVRLEVVAVAQAAADLDDTLDQICKEVEIALADPVATLANIAKSIVLTETSFDMQREAQQPTGTATMVYDVEYYTKDNAPDVGA